MSTNEARDKRTLTLADKLPEIFTYHAPDDDDKVKYQALRMAALNLAQAIVDYTPTCADQTAAVRLVREAVMTANSAIALKGLM